MKKGCVFVVGLVFLALTVSTLHGCSKLPQEIKSGMYVTNNELVSLIIEEDRTFRLNRHIATSYDPTGNYIVDGDNLVLQVNGDEKETIEFRIKKDTLIFKSGELAEGLIKKGTEFIYENKKEQLWDYRPMISLGELLYFDTGKVKKQLSEEWVAIGTIGEVCSSTEPIKMEADYYIANRFSVGTKIYGKKQDLNIIYVEYDNKFIEYVLQDNQS